MSPNPSHIGELIQQAQKGDRKAFSEIYKLYYDRLIRYGLSMDYAEDLLHDAIQDLFVWMILHPEKLNRITNLDTYLFKSLKRNIHSRLKREKGKKKNATIYQKDKPNEVSPETRLIESESQKGQSSWITSQLKKLSSHQKEVIYLRFYENLSYDEIAEIFSVSNQVVRNSVFRAVKKLRKNASKENSHLRKSMFFLFSLFF